MMTIFQNCKKIVSWQISFWFGLINAHVHVFVIDRYATEVDVDFVRKSVRAIGRCAIKVEPAAEKCVSTLLDLIQTKVNYVVQEAIVVIKVNLPELVSSERN